MHIELTDHLRCPEPHEESYLLLLPDRVEGRLVISGLLSCPECGWRVSWCDGTPDFGNGWFGTEGFPVPADGIPLMLGLEGPGGWVAVVGRAGAVAAELAERMPGVHIIAINPPAGVAGSLAVQVIRTGTWPLKAHSMRGIVAGSDAVQWSPAMLGSLLHGRQMLGEGIPPEEVEILASGAGIWIGRPRR